MATHYEGATVVTGLLEPAPVTWPVPRRPRGRPIHGGRDGRWLAASGGGPPVVWDLSARAGPYPMDLAGSTAAAPVLGFSHDGRLLLGVVAGADGSSAIAAWDVVTRARVPLPAALVEEQPVVGLWSTSDPELVVVRTTTGDLGTSDRIVTRSLRDGSVRHVLSGGRAGDPAAEVVRGGRAVATCVQDPDEVHFFVVLTATDTAAEIARLPLVGTCSSSQVPQVTGDGNHLVEVVGPPNSTYRVTRVVDLVDGAAADVVVPPGRFENVEVADPTLAVLSPPTGPPTALVRRGSSVLQLRTTSDPRDPLADNGGRARATADGRAVVVKLPDGVVVRDTASRGERHPLGSLRAGLFDLVRVSGSDELLLAGRTAGRWTIATYGLPALDAETYPVPAPVDVGPDSSFLSAVSDGDRVVALLDGLLSVWDRHTRQLIGEPTRVGEGPDEQRAFRKGMVQIRPGRADQLVLAAPDRPVLIYALAERRIVARLPVPSATGETVVDPTGSRLAVRTSQRTVELWDIDAGRRAAEPFFAPGASTLVGFSGDGYLVTADGSETVQWWDLGRGALSGTVRLPGGGWTRTTPSTRCSSAATTPCPDACRSAPRCGPTSCARRSATWTDSELRALPTGAQDRHPCP